VPAIQVHRFDDRAFKTWRDLADPSLPSPRIGATSALFRDVGLDPGSRWRPASGFDEDRGLRLKQNPGTTWEIDFRAGSETRGMRRIAALFREPFGWGQCLRSPFRHAFALARKPD
jgi:hypothetical protein